MIDWALATRVGSKFIQQLLIIGCCTYTSQYGSWKPLSLGMWSTCCRKWMLNILTKLLSSGGCWLFYNKIWIFISSLKLILLHQYWIISKPLFYLQHFIFSSGAPKNVFCSSPRVYAMLLTNCVWLIFRNILLITRDNYHFKGSLSRQEAKELI